MFGPKSAIEDAQNELGNVFKTVESNNSQLLDLQTENIPDNAVFDVMNGQEASHFDHETLNVPKQDNYLAPEHEVNPENNVALVIIRAGVQLDYQRKLITTRR